MVTLVSKPGKKMVTSIYLNLRFGLRLNGTFITVDIWETINKYLMLGIFPQQEILLRFSEEVLVAVCRH